MQGVIHENPIFIGIYPWYFTDQPDAPLDVQVEAGPKEGSLLVTWLPVTITTTGMSNGVLVTGYAVYAEGTKVKEVNNPIGMYITK